MTSALGCPLPVPRRGRDGPSAQYLLPDLLRGRLRQRLDELDVARAGEARQGWSRHGRRGRGIQARHLSRGPPRASPRPRCPPAPAGTAYAATSATPSRRAMALSTSKDEMFSPRRRMQSLVRSTKVTQPSSSMVPESPVWNQKLRHAVDGRLGQPGVAGHEAERDPRADHDLADLTGGQRVVGVGVAHLHLEPAVEDKAGGARARGAEPAVEGDVDLRHAVGRDDVRDGEPLAPRALVGGRVRHGQITRREWSRSSAVGAAGR